MFNELFSDLQSSFDELRYGTPTRVITVAKPYCSPARNIITGALQPYGVKIYGDIKEYSRMAGVRGMFKQLQLSPESFDGGVPVALPIATIAEIRVSEKAAAWAEYLLLRTGALYVPGRYVNRRNAEWAKRHGGVMPPAWSEGKPWIEASCKDGVKAWEQAKRLAKR